jgi:hypothetical protein
MKATKGLIHVGLDKQLRSKKLKGIDQGKFAKTKVQDLGSLRVKKGFTETLYQGTMPLDSTEVDGEIMGLMQVHSSSTMFKCADH